MEKRKPNNKGKQTKAKTNWRKNNEGKVTNLVPVLHPIKYLPLNVISITDLNQSVSESELCAIDIIVLGRAALRDVPWYRYVL